MYFMSGYFGERILTSYINASSFKCFNFISEMINLESYSMLIFSPFTSRTSNFIKVTLLVVVLLSVRVCVHACVRGSVTDLALAG